MLLRYSCFVHEILRQLKSGQRVLDLGCAAGSFPDASTAAAVFRADLEVRAGFAALVSADARRMPFRPHSFQSVILNHSLEHIDHPVAALGEIRRILQPDGFLYVAVPDASTLTDRIYRWLARGGGHVNPFVDPNALVRLIEKETGRPHVATRLLFSGLSFLNRRNVRTGMPLRSYVIGGGAEWTLRWGTYLLRRMDDILGTRMSVYGWAFWFGAPLDVESGAWRNVCIGCGSAHHPRVWKCEALRPRPTAVRIVARETTSPRTAVNAVRSFCATPCRSARRR